MRQIAGARDREPDPEVGFLPDLQNGQKSKVMSERKRTADTPLRPSTSDPTNMSAPSLSDGVHSATSSLESATKAFLSKQRKKRLRKAHDNVLPIDEERSLAKRERMANHAAQHGSHILKSLTMKRKALDLAVAALGTCTDACLGAMGSHFSASSSASGNDTQSKAVIQSILEHYFINYLRLRDGLVLLTSGECRHPGDSKKAQSKKASFKSSFGTDSTARCDGYTALFRAEGGYSGTGWDEFYDEHLGVRTRLVDACLACAGAAPPRAGGWTGNRVKVWEKLLESGAETFESALDMHDTETKAITSKLEQNRQKLMNGFNDILGRVLRDKGAGGRAGKILTMVTTDKFERIELQNANALGISHLLLERRGDNVRINDDGGVLPSNWDLSRWKQTMKLPDELSKVSEADTIKNQGKRASSAASLGSTKTKKRRIIDDSDSSDDDGVADGNSIEKASGDGKPQAKAPAPPTSGISGGLKVKVKSADTSTPTTGDIAEIKSSFGVDVEALSRGRENLEAEQKKSAAAAVTEEAATAAGVRPGSHMFATTSAKNEEDAVRMEELKEGINELREDVKSCEKILKNVDPSKAEDRWDARESLREVKMMLGNDLLELNAIIVGGSKQTLDYAKSLFLDSIELISEQFKCIEAVTSNEDENTKKLMQRGLVLLRGRAETNAGIALLEEGKLQRQMQQSRTIGDGIRAKGNSTKTLLEAAKHLQKAVDDASLLKEQIASIPPSSRSEAEQKLLFEALSLHVLALCRHGDVLWFLGRRKDAAEKFELAATLNDDEAEIRVAASSVTGLEMCIELLCERYFASTALIDHASSAAEKVPMGGGSSSKDGKDQIIDLVFRGYDLAASISDKMRRVIESDTSHLSFKDVCEERDILSKESLAEAKADVKKWWESRKTAASLPNVGDRPPDRAALHREFLSRSRMPSRPPTATITVAGSARASRGNDKHSQNASQNDNKASSRRLALKQGPASTTTSGTSPSSVAYRKWGDQLLPNRGEGGFFPYPACAPELPVDMQSRAEDNF